MAFSAFTLLCNHHLFLIPEHSITPKRSPISISSYSHPLPSPWQPLTTNSLCLWICLFWMFPISGITPCVSFCVWLLSLSIVFSGSVHIVVSVSAAPLFVAAWWSRVWRDTVGVSIIYWWTVGLCPPLAAVNRAAVHISVQISELVAFPWTPTAGPILTLRESGDGPRGLWGVLSRWVRGHAAWETMWWLILHVSLAGP